MLFVPNKTVSTVVLNNALVPQTTNPISQKLNVIKLNSESKAQLEIAVNSVILNMT